MAKEEEKKVDVKGHDNSFGIASVVLAIVSLISFPLQGLVLSIVGFFFSQKQKKISKNKWAKAGMILSIIGIILAILGFVLNMYLINNPQLLSQFQSLPNA